MAQKPEVIKLVPPWGKTTRITDALVFNQTDLTALVGIVYTEKQISTAGSPLRQEVLDFDAQRVWKINILPKTKNILPK